MGFKPDVVRGRGAWTKTGKSNSRPQYTVVERRDGLPDVDGRWQTDDNFRAVHLAVKHSIQPAIGLPPAQCDGLFGPGSSAQLKRWQDAQGLVPDGFFGPRSARAAFRPLVVQLAALERIPAADLYGIIEAESLFDPGAVGYSTPADRGLAQVSLEHHGPGTADGFTEAQVHTAAWAVGYNARRLAASRAKFDGKGADLQRRASLLEHNNPVNALHLYRTGEYRTAQARDYVSRVLKATEAF